MKQIVNELSKEVTELKDRGEIGLFAELKLQNIINKLKEAINYPHCCKSDSELLCDEGNLGKIKKLYTKVGDDWVEYTTE